jgi:molybdopterin molybdotransferase
MISVNEALQHVLARARPLDAVRVPTLEAVGLTLAEDIASDVDSPPHDKSMMDGYALTAEDLAWPSIELNVLEEITAGTLPTKSLSPGSTSRIMTGAPIPQGTVGVVMIERTETLGTPDASPQRVKILDTRLPAGGNILRRASSLARGQTVMRAGAQIRPIEVGVLAEVGKTHIAARRRPRVAVMTSGNELVTADQSPAAGQIRNSNNPMVTALAQRAGADATDLGIARDERNAIRALVNRGLQNDILVLSGGVSAGVLDLVPSVLQEAGVVEVFHKVNLKPGKPLWFGVRGDTLVFGMPGNPVASLVCFELFVRPAIAQMLGGSPDGLPRAVAKLAGECALRGDRATYFPGRRVGCVKSAPTHQNPISAAPWCVVEDSTHPTTDVVVEALPWLGSADLAALSQADCLIHFAAGDRTYAAGENVVISWL